MASGRKFFVGGNWKMNGNKKEIDGIIDFLTAGPLDPNTGFHIYNWFFITFKLHLSPAYILYIFVRKYLWILELVCGVPSIYLAYALQKLPATVGVAAQNCYKVAKGAFTGIL